MKYKYAFVTGMGRSGTKFLASFLGIDPKVYSIHEYIGNREYKMLSWYLGDEYSKVLLKKAKTKIDSKTNKDVFIDVNAYLSDSTASLKEIFEDSKIFHLVRNPKKVVPSLMIRRDNIKIHKIPKTQNEIEAWVNMTKLEQVCVNWVQTTEDLLKSDTELLLFESLISDYGYLSEKVLSPLNLNISNDQYNNFKKRKINKTRGSLYRYLYAKYKGKGRINKSITFEDFDKKQHELFYKICGPTMQKLGYK